MFESDNTIRTDCHIYGVSDMQTLPAKLNQEQGYMYIPESDESICFFDFKFDDYLWF